MTRNHKLPLHSTPAAWIPAVTAAIYPWILDAFHWSVTPSASVPDAHASPGAMLLDSLLLIAAFAVPLINLMIASASFRVLHQPLLSAEDVDSPYWR